MTSKLTVTTKGEEINFTGVVSKGDKQSFVVHNDGSVTIKADSIEFKNDSVELGDKGLIIKSGDKVIIDGDNSIINFDNFKTSVTQTSDLLNDVNIYHYTDGVSDAKETTITNEEGEVVLKISGEGETVALGKTESESDKFIDFLVDLKERIEKLEKKDVTFNTTVHLADKHGVDPKLLAKVIKETIERDLNNLK